jgi:hypothetical protein
MADCRICKNLRENGGDDCDVYPEDYLEPCTEFDPIREEG